MSCLFHHFLLILPPQVYSTTTLPPQVYSTTSSLLYNLLLILPPSGYFTTLAYFTTSARDLRQDVPLDHLVALILCNLESSDRFLSKTQQTKLHFTQKPINSRRSTFSISFTVYLKFCLTVERCQFL